MPPRIRALLPEEARRMRQIPPRHDSRGETWRYGERYVCNCARYCQPINILMHAGAITPDEWGSWHAASTLYLAALLSDIPEQEEELTPLNAPTSLQYEEETTDMPTPSTFVCARCHISKPARYRHPLHLEQFTSGYGTRVCRACGDNFYVIARFHLENRTGVLTGGMGAMANRHYLRLIPSNSEHMVRLQDISEYVSIRFAETFAHRTTNNMWFLSLEAARAAEDRQRAQQRETLNSLLRVAAHNAAPHVFGYHEVNNIQLYGWPEVTARDSLCFGVELEMENHKNPDVNGGIHLSLALGGRIDQPRDAAAGRPKNRFILARDGSLNASGIELITNPYTLDYHQQSFGWKELLRPAVLAGACAGKHTTNCGMHVHVNRAAISPLILGKALIFVNAAHNRPLIERVAQRTSNSYTNLRPKKMADGRLQSTAKYEAMHLTGATVEFRIFRSNLRADRVLKNIEFCHSVISYVATISVQDCAVFTPYLQFLVSNAKLYPNLVSFLRENDTIAIRKGSPQIQISEEI